MQCVKLRSIMGSYMNIHLNLFPVYVLLLLLTLSHGRPSSGIREPWLSKTNNHNNNNNQKSNSKLPSTSSVNVNTIFSLPEDENNGQSSSSVNLPNDIQVMGFYPQNQYDLEREENGEDEDQFESPREWRKATGSGGSSGSKSITWIATTTAPPRVIISNDNDVIVENEIDLGTDSGNYYEDLLAISEMDHDNVATTTEKKSLISPNLKLDQDSWNDLLEEKIEDLKIIDNFPLNNDIATDEKLILEGTRKRHNRHGVKSERETEDAEIIKEEENNEESEDSEQLQKFRINILKELGFPDNYTTERFSRSAINSTEIVEPSIVYPTAYIPSSNIITPKWNVSEEELMGAYTQYMHNVKQRKESQWGSDNARGRRKNAVTFVENYYDYGSDSSTSSGGVFTTFSFDIIVEQFTKEGNIRIRRAILSLPISCTLSDKFIPTSNSISANESMDEEPMMRYDLTENVTSWVYHGDSSPFQIIASCSNNQGTNSTTSISNTQRRKASLKLINTQLPLPTGNSRRKRSAQKSTLENFKNKQGGGRDCTKTRRGKTCCRRSLKVKFSDLGISDVIIEPQEFDAHVCVGRCNAKRVAYSTTHAMFQHILHQTKGKKFAPRPCCTPTKLTELDVIHLDPTGTKLQVTVLKDAIVEECGCS